MKLFTKGQLKSGSKSVVCARVGGANTTPFLAAHFAKRNTKNCGGEKARARREFIFPTPLFFPAPPERKSFLEIKVRIFVKKGSDFVQKVPPIYNFSVFEGCCLALAEFIPPIVKWAGLGLGKSHDFERIFEVAKQFLPAQAEVRFAEGKHKFEKFINQSFFFRFRRKAKR